MRINRAISPVVFASVVVVLVERTDRETVDGLGPILEGGVMSPEQETVTQVHPRLFEWRATILWRFGARLN